MLIPDLVGFTDNRAYAVIPYASVTRNGIVTAIVDTLTSVGWTILSGPTAGSFGGSDYELYSAQSPWHDPSNIPSWYLGGRVYMKISHPASNSIGFQFGEYYNGSVEEEMTGSDDIDITFASYAANSGNFFVIGNPFECYVGIDISSAPSGTEFYCGALNVPKPVQEQQEVISSIIADRFRIGTLLEGSTLVYSCWRTNGVAPTSWFGNPSNKATFLTVKGASQGSLQYRSGRRIWRRDKDPLMTDAQVWNPFPLPAQVALAISSASGTLFWRGFMYDALIISENATQGSYLDFINKSWYCYASGNNATDTFPGSLWLNLGPSGTLL